MRFATDYITKSYSPRSPPVINSSTYSALFMIGDSLMRYQYLSLAYFLRHDHFMSKEEFTSIHMMSFNETSQKLFSLPECCYLDFFARTSAYLAPFEFCDCKRDFFWNNVYENRYYKDSSKDICISVIMFIGDKMPLRGQWLPNHPFFSNDSLRMPVSDEVVLEPPTNWNFTIQEFLEHVVPTFDPTAFPKKAKTLVLNAGMWLNSFGLPSYALSVIESARKSFDRVIWKTTNCRRKHLGMAGIFREEVKIDSFMCSMLECFNIDWTCNLKHDDLVDEGHFVPWVYDKINEQFMEHMERQPLDKAKWQFKIIQVNSTAEWPPLPLEGQSLPEGTPVFFFVDESGNLRLFSTGNSRAANSCVGVLDNRGVVVWTIERLSRAILSGAVIKDECHDQSLVKGAGKAVFLMENNTLRAFTSLAAFVARGFDFENVRLRDEWLLLRMRRGANI